MLSMMLRRIATLEGDAAADEEEQSTGALIGTYMGEFGVVSCREHILIRPLTQPAQIQSVLSLSLCARIEFISFFALLR